MEREPVRICSGALAGRYSSITTCRLISGYMEMRHVYVLCILSTLVVLKKKKKKKRQFQSVCIYLFSEKVNPKGFCFKGTDLSAVDKKMNVAVTSIIYQIECD